MAQVTIYSTPTCGYCKQLKAYLDEKEVAYTDFDVTQDPAKQQEAMEKAGGQMSVPVIDIDGTIIVGFDKDKVNEALGL